MNIEKTQSILFAGLGGQGILVASGITALAAFHAGYDVKQSEVHGMAQRGGSVSSQIRFGKKVHSPLIPQGTVDILVAVHPRESARNRSQVRPGGVIIDPSIPNAEEELKNKWGNLYLLGVLSHYLPFSPEAWHSAIRSVVPQKYLEVNMMAFARGTDRIL